jgi:hypothetical protein
MAGVTQQPPPYWQQPPPYWQPPPRIDASQLRPSRVWYWLSPIPAVVGTILAIVFVIAFIERLDPDIDNFRSNRAAVVDVQSGDRAIYVQTRDNGRPLALPPGDLRCSVSFACEPVTVDGTSGSTLDVNSDSYVAEYKFDAPRDGPYRVSCEGPEGLRMAIGPHLSFGLFVPLAIAIGAFLAGVVATAVVVIVTAVSRSNHKQRLQREALQHST